MKIVSTIEARMGSTRCPGKAMESILGRPMLELVVERLQRAKRIDEIIIATTDRVEDNCIAELSERIGIPFYRGSSEDVLERILQAAKSHHANIIVEMTSDCPLLDPELIDQMITIFLNGKVDYLTNNLVATFPQGLTIRIFWTRVLEEASCVTCDPVDREHPSIYIFTHPMLYRIRNVKAPPEYRHPEYRWTVDYEEDLKLVREIYEHLYPENPEFTTKDIILLMDREPELSNINAHCTTKADESYLGRKRRRLRQPYLKGSKQIIQIIRNSVWTPRKALRHFIRRMRDYKTYERLFSKEGFTYSIANEVMTIAQLTPWDAYYLFYYVKRIQDGGAYLELGSFMGGSLLCAYLANKKSGSNITFATIDSFVKKTERGESAKDYFLRHTKSIPVKLIESDSDVAKDGIVDDSVDLLFIDGSHEYGQAIKDLINYWPKIKGGGILLGHDYRARGGVTQAVDELFGDRVIALKRSHMYMVRKDIDEIDSRVATVEGDHIPELKEINKNTERHWDEKLKLLCRSKGIIKKRRAVYYPLLQAFDRGSEFSLLDIGCGLGSGLAFLAEHFPHAHLYGLDFSNYGISFGRKHYPKIKFILADIRSYQFTRRFDYICLMRVLEHMRQPFKVLNKCLSATLKSVLVSLPHRGACSEHVSHLQIGSFDAYITEKLKNPKYIHGQTFVILGKR